MMRAEVKPWTVLDLYKNRDKLQFPIYQRESNLWKSEEKSKFIDSIMIGLDIPKIYLYKNDNDTFDCVDGRQRIETIWGFFDGEVEWDDKYWDGITLEEQRRFEDYKLTITLIHDASDEELRELFIRLQLGLPLNGGEKLNAITGQMKDLVFKLGNKDNGHAFFVKLGLPDRRHAKEVVCAQIFLNSINKHINNEFHDAGYDDLEEFLNTYKNLNSQKDIKQLTDNIIKNLDIIFTGFKEKTSDIRSRAMAVSIYLFLEELIEKGRAKQIDTFVEFYEKFYKTLREEAAAGLNRKNKYLYEFEKATIQAAYTRTSIQSRDDLLREFFDFYLKEKSILGS
jgi:hypothetical protein